MKKRTQLLSVTTNPEEKRKIIGDTFIRIADEIVRNLNLNPDHVFLGQGTLRPDLIESASSLASTKADAIKTHHNDTELVRKLRETGRVVEPLKDFHKDEVRVLGRDLGLPEELIQRHPFPGPGLAVRIICSDAPYMERDFNETAVILKVIVGYATAVQKVSNLGCQYYCVYILSFPLKKHSVLSKIDMVTTDEDKEFLKTFSTKYNFASTLLPIRSVGVQGDARSYSYVAGLSEDAPENETEEMVTEKFAALAHIAKLIPRICHNINRVCYIFGKEVKPPVLTITHTTLTPHVIDQLREADYIANTLLHEHGYGKLVSQMPIILIPIHFDRDVVTEAQSCQRSVVIRTFITEDFMTGVPAIPNKHIPFNVSCALLCPR